MIIEELVTRVSNDFALPIDSIHGISHWLRVRHFGLTIAKLNGANSKVVEIFAILHDAKRENDGADPNHGERAAFFFTNDLGSYYLSKSEAEKLIFACKYHSHGLMSADITIQTCWDADRLDLWRLNIQPDPKMLGTAVAKNPMLISWASVCNRFNISKPTHAS